MVGGGVTVCRFFSFVGKAAQEGHAFYRAVAKHLSDPDVRALFLKLAADELEHVRAIERMAERPEEHLTSGESSLVAECVQRVVDAQIARPASKAGRMARTIGGLVEAIGLGIAAEECAVELYTMAVGEARTEEAAEVFRQLLEMEKRHLVLLAELKKRLTTEPQPES